MTVTLKQTDTASLYFTLNTITTVGYGFIVPNTTSSRIFSLFYDTAGIALLAFNVGVLRETVIEAFET